ncbi:methyltransferase domain-containing protein [Nocardioides perillae]|uniref:SAM-dependent methyltransferase n=1 Tax=Nocardioides perillae TaxID=1119534 RepID=A0A7Y9RWM9_9ACTN|nr:SAM-dependent methyltransferase [Nocardioides perillae]
MDAAAWDARYAASAQVWSAEPNVFVAQACTDLPPGRAADVACGEGRNAAWLAERGWSVTALDFSAVAVEKTRALAERRGLADRVAARVDDATRWQAEAPLDLVVLCYLQLAAPARGEAVRRAFSALAPGGTLLVVAHDSSNLAEGTGGPQDPAVLYRAEDVLADLDPTAYDVVRAGRVARTVGASSGGPAADPHRGEPERTAWDCLVQLRRPAPPAG